MIIKSLKSLFSRDIYKDNEIINTYKDIPHLYSKEADRVLR